jgi:hypothetical protein
MALIYPDYKRSKKIRDIKPYTKPRIVKTNPNKWYIEFHYAVPAELQKNYPDLYPRSTKRFKVYKGLNEGFTVKNLTEEQRLQKELLREERAEEIRELVEYSLKLGLINPFEDQLKSFKITGEVKKEIAHSKTVKEEDRRKAIVAKEAFNAFIQNRKSRDVEAKTIEAYESAIEWILDGIPEDIKVGDIRYRHISDAMGKVVKDRKWKPGTVNHHWEYANTLFRWLYAEDYVAKNPLEGKIEKIKTTTTLHKWFDRIIAKQVKPEIRKVEPLYRACQFIYWVMIRSNKELMNIKVGDIDFDLHQIRFRKEWTKNDSDQNRDYPDELARAINDMGLRKLPKHYYIFGKQGLPSPYQCDKNWFSRRWDKVREKCKLSNDYTMYGWKHTRIVHMMMLGKSSYEISHAARHSNTKTTEDYKKDYDITLVKIYKEEDLTF